MGRTRRAGTREHLAGTREHLAGARKRLRRLRKKHGPEVLYSYAFPTQGYDPGLDREDHTLVEVTEDNLAALRKGYPKELNARKHQILRGRIDHPSETCWLIQDADRQLCGYCHVAWQDNLNARINHLVKVGPTQAYFFDDYVVKRHRGKKLHAFSIARRLQIASARGVTEGITTISKNNHPSNANYAKFGMRTTRTLVFLPRWKKTLQLRKR